MLPNVSACICPGVSETWRTAEIQHENPVLGDFFYYFLEAKSIAATFRTIPDDAAATRLNLDDTSFKGIVFGVSHLNRMDFLSHITSEISIW